MKEVNKYLKRWTGEGSLYWLNRIGKLIGDCAKPIKGHKGLFTCKANIWVSKLAKELDEKLEAKLGAMYDNNIALAKMLGLILALWGIRIGRAKGYDCRRELKGRRKSLQNTITYNKLLAECLLDESMDHLYFPSQEWDPPFSKSARYEPDEAELKRQAYAKEQRK